ncbi:MAG: 3-deoxy-D-manno-octulosonic acid transferase [Thermonemataceae bacterium]
MGIALYNTIIYLYKILLNIVALWHPKAKKFVKGRKGLLTHIEDTLAQEGSPRVWFHCASLGEFEQARPVLEAFKRQYPTYVVVLTFFSPSGYEVIKKKNLVDYTFYLPLDTAKNAQRLLTIVRPQMIFFVKYEFWYHYLTEAQRRHIPLLLFSAIFRSSQPFFQPYGQLHRTMLQCFTHIFVQNEHSRQLLAKINIHQVSVSGDTRFDRVATIEQQGKSFPLVETFKNQQPLLIAGSTWEEDLKVLLPLIQQARLPFKYVIAPHEIHKKKIIQLKNQCNNKAIRFSEIGENTNLATYDVLLIDNVGMLATLYRYGDFAYVGGGFGKGLHNILEPATFGMPIFFGNKNYRKFQEAVELTTQKVSFPIEDTKALATQLEALYHHKKMYQQVVEHCKAYVKKQIGSTQKIMQFVAQLFTTPK